MSELSILVVISTVIALTHSFFTYSDCDATCQSKMISCIITEQTARFFVCHCLENELDCEMLATPRVVCLRPLADPIGGDDIWSDYEKRDTTTTTTAAPPKTTVRPTPVPTATFRVTVILTLAAVLTAAAAVTIFKMLRRHSRRSGYEPLMQPSAADSLYQRTVEPLSQPETMSDESG